MVEQSSDRPFAGLTVVELIDTPAGEATGKLLGDLGADVVKVEPADGVPSRRQGPFAGGTPDPDRSLEFWAYGTSKRSLIADASTADGAAIITELCRRADILLVCDEAPLTALGTGFEQLQQENPRLIIVSITPFGISGPWSGYLSSDLIALAAGGLLNSCGYDDHSIPPIRPGGNQGYQLGAIFAYLGALLALIDRQQSGLGQVLDVSIHGANAVSGELANPYWFYPQAIVQRQTCRHAQPVPTQPALFECADGVYVYLALILADQRSWQSLVEWMDAAGLAADLVDAEYSALAYRQQQFGHIQQLLEVFFMLQDSETAYHEGQRRGLPIGPLKAFEDLPRDEQLVAREFFEELSDGFGGSITYPGAPYRFSSFTAQPSRAPKLGEHTEEILAELGMTAAAGASR